MHINKFYNNRLNHFFYIYISFLIKKTKDYPLSNQKSVGCGPYGAFSSKITPTRPTNTLVTYLESNVVAKDLYDLNDL